MIYVDLESLIKKLLDCKNNPEKSSTTKLGWHNAYVYLISTLCMFDDEKISMKNTCVRNV